MESAASSRHSRASGRSTGFWAFCTWLELAWCPASAGPRRRYDMLKELRPGLMMMLVMTVLTGFIYPAAITAIAQVVFRDQANGSLIESNGQVIGSRLIGQNFTRPEYFQPRPSS